MRLNLPYQSKEDTCNEDLGKTFLTVFIPIIRTRIGGSKNNIMKSFREKIYIGECSDGVVYFNTKTHEVLISDKSKLLNTKKSRNNYKYAAFGTAVLILFIAVLKAFDITIGLNAFTIIPVWLIQNISLCYLIERALYKYVNKTKLGNKAQLRQAIYSNNIWNGFVDKRVTFKKKAWWGFITLLLSAPAFIIVFSFIIDFLNGSVNFRKNIELNQFFGFVFVGFTFFFFVFLVFQNNILRWFHVVEKYQENKLNMVTEKTTIKKEVVLNETILPLGSVVTLKDGDGTELMIISRAVVVGDMEEEFFDYGSVIVTEGMSSIEEVYFFNRENVGEIVFKGYINKNEEEYIRTYDEKISKLQINKGTVN